MVLSYDISYVIGKRDDDRDSAIEDAASSTASLTSSIQHYRQVNGRTYHADCGDNIYWGPNDNLQNGMVDIMHHAYTLALGDKLYLAPLPEHIDKALDIGTGTGVWAIDFADERPETQVIGTDISPIQPTWVPPNLEFQIEDMAQDWTFPSNAFDFVHIRWMIGSVVDWNALFKKAYNVLKPGGWLESYELDADIQCDDDSIPSRSAVADYGYIFREGGKKIGTEASFNPVGDRLQRKAFDASGFVNIKETPIKMPMSEWPKDPKQREIGLYTRAVIFHDTEGIFNYMASKIEWSPENVSVYAAHLRRELKSLNVHCYYRSLVVIGQKPVAE
ncbi:methyltransferase type 11 [Grosmannia clavigera kw1407]|uniref:Methyltransferase type 11 n=1 Tax=Grosmannia clavigera (strain kw1407 / UAMH 11150) TaxID=655863 RepID=F0XFX3_GROCL|nr:methyltransferase type 11 [Grosmannia clavigera kw1407]EFX03419.1 methyltransferase type 11 [Grosmannia clavigera kw1407]